MLTCNDGFDNGCIINTAFQVASEPLRIAVSVQQNNLTRSIIEKSGKFNLNVLTESVPFEMIRRFGMQTGREVDKFKDFSAVNKSENGLLYLTENANAFLSVEVNQKIYLGSHTLFIGEVTQAEVLSKENSCTYGYYHKNIKPKT